MSPTEHAALRTLNIGRTVPIMISTPLPSSPNIAVSATRTPTADTGDESLPRSPNPSNGPSTQMPGELAGTSQRVLNPPSDRTGWDDQTYADALDADVTQLFRASRIIPSPSRFAVLMGAQK